MKEHGGWEQVHSEITTEIGHAALMHRMKVPGGWIYMHTTIKTRRWIGDQYLKSLVFVPEPKENSR